MKNFSKFYLVLIPLLLIGIFFVAQGVSAATTVTSQATTLSPGWNIVSTPKVLLSHQFSAAETSDNFEIYLLDPTATSGWQTMQGEGQTEFQPLFAYFINNKTGQNQTLIFNYNFSLTPDQRLFQRTLQPGWNAIGIASPSYAVSQGSTAGNTGNPSEIISPINGSIAQVIDFTNGNTNLDSPSISGTWASTTVSGINSLNDFRELKAYGVFVTSATSNYIGSENLSSPTQYNLTYNAGANGSITGTSPQTVSSGLSGTTVTAVPNPGYKFTGWSDGITTPSRTDTNITSNINVTANFVFGTSLSISQDSSFANVATLIGGASNVKMASFTFTSYGEDTKVMSLTFTPTIYGTGTTLANVGLYVNGGQVGSNATATTATPITFPNLGSNLIVPVGSPETVAIYGDAITSGGTNYSTGNVEFDLTSGTAQGVSSSQTVTVPAQGGQSLAISTSNVAFAATTGFSAVTAAPNSMVKIGSFTLQTASAEGITVNNIAVTFPSGGTNTLIPANQLTNLKVMVGSTQIGTPIGQPVITTANNFSTNTVVPISSTTVFDVYANIGSSPATDTVRPWMTVTYRGLTSNLSTSTSATDIGVTTSAGTPTIDAGGVTFVPGSSLTAQYVTGNASTTLPIATFNVVTNSSISGGATLKDVTFTVGAANTVSTITINGVTCSVVSTTATCYNVGIVVPNGTSGVNIPVSVTLVPVGPGSSAVSGSTVSLEITTLTYNNGTTVQTISPSATSASLELVGTVPTVTLVGGSSTGLYIGTQVIGSFTVSAGSGGDIKLQDIPIVTSTSGGVTGLTAITLEDASGTMIATTNTVSSGAQTFTFGTPRTISKATSETYYVYGTVAASGGLGNSGTSAVTFTLGDKGSFEWTDVAGNQAGLTGTNIYGYPTSSQSKSN